MGRQAYVTRLALVSCLGFDPLFSCISSVSFALKPFKPQVWALFGLKMHRKALEERHTSHNCAERGRSGNLDQHMRPLPVFELPALILHTPANDGDILDKTIAYE